MTTAQRWMLAVALAVVALGVALAVAATLAGAVLFAGPDPGPRSCLGGDAAEELQVTREWGRLGPIPPGRTACQVQVEGSAFTRGFRVEFVAPAAEVTRWLDDSPGLREARVEGRPPRYLITPGGGAQHAEVTVHPESGGTVRVEIYVYWS